MSELVVDSDRLRELASSLRTNQSQSPDGGKSNVEANAPGMPDALPTALVFNPVAEASRNFKNSLTDLLDKLTQILGGVCDQLDGSVSYYEGTDMVDAAVFDSQIESIQ